MTDDAIEPDGLSTSRSKGVLGLLRLQERDSAIDQLLHRREHLRGHEVIANVQEQAGVLRPLLLQATAKRDEKAGEQAALEAEVEALDHRITEINNRLYGSTPVGPKDAQAMSEEIQHLEQRKSRLEDSELEVMEVLEPLQGDVARLEAQAHDLAGELQVARAEIAKEQGELDAVIANERLARTSIASAISQDLISEYDRLRKALGGVAIARLAGSSCGGCHLSLSATELDRFRKMAPGELFHCEECGRILVEERGE